MDISTFPLRYFVAGVPESKAENIDAAVGNDVWIGYDAFMRGTARIGDGAIVAAKSVVTKDVPPYAVVAGNPAREIKERFPAQLVQRLQELRWWDLPDEFVLKNIDVFYSSDRERLEGLARKARS